VEELKVTPAPVQPAPKQQLLQQHPQPQQKQQQQLSHQPQQVPQQPQQQSTRKEAVGSSQPNSLNPHITSQMKRDVHPSSSVPNVTSLRPTVQPMPGVQMPIPFHHPPAQVPLQFGGHGAQLQPQVVPSSFQMSMGLTGSSTPQVPQQLYAPTLQHHQLQQQAMMHPGQGMGYVPSVAHQFPQLGNIPMSMASQYPQQQPNKHAATRKTTVKITHPDTHEELKLDKRMDSSGQRAAPNLTQQSQPVGSYAPHMGFFHQQPNSYNQSGMYYSTPAGVNQVATGSSGPRFNYPVTQSGQAMTYISPSAAPPVSGQSQYTVKPHPVGLLTEKSHVTISAPPAKSEPPKLRAAEDAASSRQKDNEVVSGIIVSSKSTLEKERSDPLVTVKHSTVISPSLPMPTHGAKPQASVTSSLTANSVSPVAGADGKSEESIQRTGSFKDNNKNIVTKKDVRNSSEPPKVCCCWPLSAMLCLHFS
jgi:translation initiation factor 4G